VVNAHGVEGLGARRARMRVHITCARRGRDC
jgi:hypothetical protein